jgi:branched-subunit amino acid aminotransferase/4-amino-4-deoxychorismate lyase
MNISSFSKNGVITPIQEALIPLDNLEYAYGYGVYETLKVRKGKLFFVKEHVERLFLSCELIELEHIFTHEQIEKYIQELVTALEVDACNIKMMLIGGKAREDATLYIFATAPLFPDRKLYKQGAKTKTYKYERWLPNAKSLNMLPSYLIYKKALTADCYDGLLIDRDGCIREGTRTNFFCIKGMEIISPPTEKILEGVTRKTIISVLTKNGYGYVEKNIPLADISKYDGAFLTSTSTKIIPIKQIDNFVYPEIPENLKKLMKIYDLFLDELVTISVPVSIP